MSEAYKRQEAGDHYVNMGMQPFHFAMVNHWDAAAFSILKYLSRHRKKNGIEDLRKARHIVDIRQTEFLHTVSGTNSITIGSYIAANHFSGQDATALCHLADWVFYGHDAQRIELVQIIEAMIREYEALI